MKKAMPILMILVIGLLVPSVAAGHFLPKRYGRNYTRDVARGLYLEDRDAKYFGVEGRCARGSAHHVKCIGYYGGEIVDAAGVPQPWECDFVIRFVLLFRPGFDYHGYKVKAGVGGVQCFGPGITPRTRGL